MKKIVNTIMIESLLAVLVLTLTACTATVDTKPLFDSYTARFNAAQPHISRMVKRADGFNIHVREFGQDNRTSGQVIKPTIVMMHGFPDNQKLYDLLAPILAKTHYVVTFDFLGWGESEKPQQHLYDVASQRADLDAVVAALKLDALIIVVHDLSGHAGIDWALDNETKTASLVLLNTYYGNMPSLVAPEAIEFYASKGVLRDIAAWGATKAPSRFQGNFEGQISKFFVNVESRNTFVPIFSYSSPSIRPAFFSSTAVLWDEVAARDKKLPRVQQFKKPVQVIFGADDPYLNAGVAVEFGRIFSNSRVSLVEKAGHYVQLDRADEVAKIMQRQL
jgi:haloalkane dehalogenase